MKVSQLIPSVRKEVEKAFPEKLARAKQLVKMFANKNACVSCSFGKDSTVVLWLCLQENPNIPVIFNNTGVEFKETLEFRDCLLKEWNLNLIETKPVKTFWEVAKEYKMPDGKKKSDRCCDYLKEIPYRRILKSHGFTHVYTGITAVESRLRMFLACERGMEYFNKKDGVWKILPLLYWTPIEIWNYIYETNIPYNAAYDNYGLERMGCVPCTSHRRWREQLAHVNPKMYAFIQRKYFNQELMETYV